MKRGRANARRAFTLVELVVSLTISSILMLAIAGSFGLGLRIWRQAEDRRPEEETGWRILAVLGQELSGVYLPGSGDQASFVWEGSSKLTFFTASPSYYRGLPFGRSARVTSEYGDGALTRTEELAAGGKVIGSPMIQTIASGVIKFEFTYPHEPGRPASGNADPTTEVRPPRLVQVRIEGSKASCVGQYLVPVEGPLTAGNG